MGKVRYIEQMENSECGLTCLAMILSYYRHHEGLSEMRERFHVNNSGMSFKNIIEVAAEYHLESYPGKLESVHYQDLPIPSLLHWDHNHFVVLEKANAKYYYVLDPAQGRLKLNKQDFEQHFSGFFIFFKPDQGFQKKKRENPLKFYLEFGLLNKKFIVFLLLSSLFLQALGVIAPYMNKTITDQIVGNSNINSIESIGWGLFLLATVYFLFSMTRGIVVTKLQNSIDQKMMGTFISTLFRLPIRFFNNRSSGDLIFRANSNNMVKQILSNKVASVVIDTSLLFLFGYLLVRESVNLGTMVVLIGCFLFLILLISTKRSMMLTDQDVIAQSKVQTITAESINRIYDIKALGLEGEVVDRWYEQFEKQLSTFYKKSVFDSLVSNVILTTQFMLPIVVLWRGSSLVMDGTMSMGTLIAINTLAVLFTNPIISLGSSYSEVVYLYSYIKRIQDVVNHRKEQPNPESLAVPKNLTGDIEIRNVSFKFGDFDSHTLTNINMTIPAGKKIGIAGVSGSGKSTLLKMIAGFYMPTEGDVYIDGKPLQHYKFDALRKRMGIIFQESGLFNRSIKENLTMLPIDDKQLRECLEKANLHHEIEKLPSRAETVIAEEGKSLSGGQRQRLLIARSLISEPDILIYDEATSALDTMNEELIDKNLTKMNVTRIIAAHRLNTIKNADYIYVLDQGSVVEEGTHENLLRKEGLYFQMYCKEEKEEFESIC